MYYVVYYNIFPTLGTFISLCDIVKTEDETNRNIFDLVLEESNKHKTGIIVSEENLRIISIAGPFSKHSTAAKHMKLYGVKQHKYSFSFQWHFTKSCNQNCVQCYLDSDHFSDMHMHPELEIEEMYKIVDEIYTFCHKIEAMPTFALTGGHPLLSSKFEQILEYIDEKYRKKGDLSTIYVLGNPQFVIENLHLLESYHINSYQISLDGMRDTHDKWRGKGSFDCSIDAINALNETKIQPRVMSTVSKLNSEEIPKLYEFLCHIGAPSFTYSRVVPNKSEKYQNYFTENFTPTEYKLFLEKMFDKVQQMREKGFSTHFGFKDHLWKPFLIEKGVWSFESLWGDNIDSRLIYDGCHINQDSLCIGTNGDVFACMRVNSKLGNILEESFEEIYCSDKANFFRKFDKYEGCNICKYKRFCRGCHAVSDGLHGDFYKADPQCWIAENLVG